MPPSDRESPPENLATQITVSRQLVAASGGLTAARAGRTLDEDDRAALGMLRDALRSAAAHKSIVAISGTLGLVSARDAAHLVDIVGDEAAAPALEKMADALAHAVEGALHPEDEQAVEDVRRLLVAISDLRLAEARHFSRSDPAEPWWPTAQSSTS